jgi:hypothetical protein
METRINKKLGIMLAEWKMAEDRRELQRTLWQTICRGKGAGISSSREGWWERCKRGSRK